MALKHDVFKTTFLFKHCWFLKWNVILLKPLKQLGKYSDLIQYTYCYKNNMYYFIYDISKYFINKLKLSILCIKVNQGIWNFVGLSVFFFLENYKNDIREISASYMKGWIQLSIKVRKTSCAQWIFCKSWIYCHKQKIVGEYKIRCICTTNLVHYVLLMPLVWF